MNLVSLMYVSSAVEELPESVLQDILRTAVRRNAGDDITGMLLYCGGNFMQVLEGEEAAVRATFERVRIDSRHKDVYLLGIRPISEREFGDWKMGFRHVARSESESYAEIAPFMLEGSEANGPNARPGKAIEMLKRLSRLQR